MKLELMGDRVVNLDKVSYFYVADPYFVLGRVEEIKVMAVFGHQSWTPVHVESVNESQTVELAKAKCYAWLKRLMLDANPKVEV